MPFDISPLQMHLECFEHAVGMPLFVK